VGSGDGSLKDCSTVRRSPQPTTDEAISPERPIQNEEVTMEKRKRYDATMRKLIEMGPPDWHAYLGGP